jgi:hypothetical protein
MKLKTAMRMKSVRRFGLLLVGLLAQMHAAAASELGDFSVVLLPDTQFYSQLYPQTYAAQTRWIRDHVEHHNIKFVIHLGDIVENHNDNEEEWRNADRAHRILDGVAPYSMLPGNHDMGKKDGKLTGDTSLYNRYFGPARFAGRSWYGGHLGDANDNNYCFFEAAGMKFMVVSLQFDPSAAVLEWANQVISSHPERRVIVATHCYMRPKARDAAVGQRVWRQCVNKHENVFLVVSGHVLGVGRQTSRNAAGRPVHELLVDHQGLPNGGDGWLSILRFSPAQNKIFVTAYSPLLSASNDAPDHTFSLDYEMAPAPASP